MTKDTKKMVFGSCSECVAASKIGGDPVCEFDENIVCVKGVIPLECPIIGRNGGNGIFLTVKSDAKIAQQHQ